MATEIHPTAIVEDGAEFDEDVTVGAFAWIGPRVRLGAHTRVAHHATVDGRSTLGRDNRIHPYAFVGAQTHDLKYAGGAPGLRVGDRNVFREYVTVHCATADGEETVLGDDNVILAYSHIAHDCVVGNHLVMSSHAALAGHVRIGDHVNFAWGAGIHQFCRVGDYAMVSAKAKVVQDVPPCLIVDGSPAAPRTVNKVGMERAGLTSEEIALARRAFKILHKDGLNRSQALAKLRADPAASNWIVRDMIGFVETTERGIA